jgi:hypothetical protein
MSNFAKNTKIDVSKSQNEIKDLLVTYNISKFAFDLNDNSIFFEIEQKPIKIHVPLPEVESFRYTPTGQKRNDSQIKQLYEQDLRARWRLMKSYIKMSLELVRLNVISIEQAFLGNYLLSNGNTISQEIIPQLLDRTKISTVLRLSE